MQYTTSINIYVFCVTKAQTCMFILELCTIFDYFKIGGEATNHFGRKDSLDSKVPCIEVLPKLISISTQFPTFFANKHNHTFRNQHKFDHYWSLHW